MEAGDVGYKWLKYRISPSQGGPVFVIEARVRDVTQPGDDATTWRVLKGRASFLATVDRPLPAPDALNLAVLLAVRERIDSMRWSEEATNRPVTVSAEHLAEGERQAARIAAQPRRPRASKLG